MRCSWGLVATVASIIFTIIMFCQNMVLFNKYVGRGRYYYQNVSNDTYMVIKEGRTRSDCSVNGTIFKYGEINWLVVRNKRHYLFLFCFWGAIILPIVTSLLGSILEYKFKSNSTWWTKIFRMLRAMAYKSSISIPVTVLFAFDYTKPCLKLKDTAYMIFPNSFTYAVTAMVFPLLIIILIDEIDEFVKRYKYKSNATDDLVTTSIENQPEKLRFLSHSHSELPVEEQNEDVHDENIKSSEVKMPMSVTGDTKRSSSNKQTPRSILHTVAYVILYLVVLLLLYLCLKIYFKLFLFITLPQQLLTVSNVLLSIANILLASH